MAEPPVTGRLNLEGMGSFELNEVPSVVLLTQCNANSFDKNHRLSVLNVFSLKHHIVLDHRRAWKDIKLHVSFSLVNTCF